MAVYDSDKLLSQFDQAPAINDVDRIVLGDGDNPNKVLYATVSDFKTYVQRGIDDTPIENETNESITSNWAFDHAAAYTAHAADITTIHLPDQGGQSNGAILKTDGSVASWTHAPKITSLLSGSAMAIQGWQISFYFFATDHNTISWAVGTLRTADGQSFNITSGNTGDMSAITYIYFNKGTSETTLQISTTAFDSVGLNIILVAVAQNVASDKMARVQVFGGYDNYSLNLITADAIAANTITGNEIFANTITASEIAGGTITATQMAAGSITAVKIDVDTLDAITATAGTITSGTFQTAVSGQRVVLNGSDNNLEWYNSNGDRIIRIDDNIVTWAPGMTIVSDKTVTGYDYGGILYIGETSSSSYTKMAEGYLELNAESGANDNAVLILSRNKTTSIAPVLIIADADATNTNLIFKIYQVGAPNVTTFTIKSNGDTFIKGDLTIDGTVDGIDVLALNTSFANHSARHEVSGADVLNINVSLISGILNIAKGGTNSSSFTANRVIVSSSTGLALQVSAITATELGYLNNVTTNIKTHMDNSSAHHTLYSPSGSTTSFIIGITQYNFTNGLMSSFHPA